MVKKGIKIDACAKAYLVHRYLAKVHYRAFSPETQEETRNTVYYCVQWKKLIHDAKKLVENNLFWIASLLEYLISGNAMSSLFMATIAYDNSGTTKDLAQAPTVSFSYTVNSNTHGAIIVGQSAYAGNTTVEDCTSVSYNGNSLTDCGKGTVEYDNQGTARLWYGLAPAIGSHTLSAVYSIGSTSGDVELVEVISLTGVNQVNSIDSTTLYRGGPATSASETVSVSNIGSMVVDFISIGTSSGLTFSSGQTTRVTNNFGSGSFFLTSGMSTVIPGSTGNHTNTWSWGGTSYQWGYLSVSLFPNDFSVSLDETVSVSDSLSNKTSKKLAETVTMSDSLTTAVIGLWKVLSESFSLLDSMSNKVSKTLTETVSMTDSLIKATAAKLLTESITIKDTLLPLIWPTLWKLITFTKTTWTKIVYAVTYWRLRTPDR